MCVACYRNYSGLAEKLIKHNANIEQAAKDGITACYIAAEIGNISVLQLLIESKANIEQTLDDGWTSIIGACDRGRADVVELLIKHNANKLSLLIMEETSVPASDSVQSADRAANKHGASAITVTATPVARSQREINLIFACLCTAVFLASLDGTVVSVSLPTIASSFGEFQLLSWVVSAYLLTSASVTPLYGKVLVAVVVCCLCLTSFPLFRFRVVL